MSKLLEGLIQKMLEATARRNAATKEFNTILGQYSGLPDPSGGQRIRDSSSKLCVARKGMMQANERLTEFIEGRVMPDERPSERNEKKKVASQ